MGATGLLERVFDPAVGVLERFTAGTQLRSLLDATLLSLSAQLAAAGDSPELRWQDSARLSARSIEREIRRAQVVDQVPALGDALGESGVSVDHVDVLDRALNRLDIARVETPERFERAVQDKVRRLLSEADREARLAKQRRDTRLRTWVHRTTGMWAEFDPLTGQRLQILIDGRHDRLFATAVPDTAPADPLERAQHLRALALIDLIDKPVTGARSEVVAVLRPDAVTEETEVEWRLPIEVPRVVLEQLVLDPATLITPVVVLGDLVLYAGGDLNIGRTRSWPTGPNDGRSRPCTPPVQWRAVRCRSTAVRSTTSSGGAMAAPPTCGT